MSPRNLPKPRLITAVFRGRCRVCQTAIAKGDTVWFSKNYGVRCQKCGPHPTDEQPIKSSKKQKRSSSAPSETRTTPLPVPVPSVNVADLRPDYTPASAITRFEARLGGDGVHRMVWSSVSDLVDDAFSDYAQQEPSRELLEALHRHHEGSKWANGHSKQTLRDAVNRPPVALMAAIDEMREQLVNDLDLPTAPRRKVRRGKEWGDELDSDRWLNRDPAAWERNEREPQPRQTLTIGVNLTVHWAQKPEELLYRGAAACALADLLTDKGLNVRIVGFSAGGDCGDDVKKVVGMVEFKRADMPLDLASLATATCDIGFFRMVVMPAEFRHLPGKLASNLGTRAAHLPGPDRKAIDYLVESSVTSREAATAWLREQAMSAGILNEEVTSHV